MKKGTLFISLLFLSTLFLSAQDLWLTSYDEAIKTAKENNQQIILSFQGSDWCAPCMKLEKQIWNTEEFKLFAGKNVVLLKADFPKRRANRLTSEQQEHNDQLAEKYNPNGYFPLVVVLDESGKALGKLGYENISATEYIERLSSF